MAKNTFVVEVTFNSQCLQDSNLPKNQLLPTRYFTMSSILDIVYVRKNFQLTILQFLLTKFLKFTAAAVLITEDALSSVSNCNNRIP